MSVTFFFLSAFFFSLSFAAREGEFNADGTRRTRPTENSHKLRIVIEKTCCSNYRTIRQNIFDNHECLERSKTSNKDLKFQTNCVIYANINENIDECYDDLRVNECVKMIHYEPIYYTDAVDYTDDICAVQDVSQDDPCLLVYSLSFGADGTQCASTYLEDDVKPFYHLNYWYPNNEMDPYAYIYLDTTGISNVENIDVWILDSGIDRNHVEFSGIDIEKIGYEAADPETFSDHGTAVASNAIGNNVGIARGFSIKDCPVCQEGSFCSLENIENCIMEVIIYYSTRPGRRFVINMSFGSYTEYAYFESFEDIVDAGGILVAAAGNDRNNNDFSPFYPANHPLVISVGGYNQDKSIYNAFGGSNYGTNSVRYYAAAENNLVALASANAPGASNELYTYVEGTSFASPIVTGEIANILTRNLSLTLEDIRAELDLRVIGNVLNCPVESCPMIEGYCNVEGATRNPTAETASPTLEPTQNPTAATTNPTMAPTILHSCITDICQNVKIMINDLTVYNSSIDIDMNDIFQPYATFKSMKIRAEGTHTWQGDLKMTITSPEGTHVLLADNVGSNNDNFNITFSDEAYFFPLNLNVNGDEYKPAESFSIFAVDFETPIGTWIFTLSDEFIGDEGIWESWCITELCFYHEEGTESPTTITNIPTSNPTSNPISYDGCEFGLYREDLLLSDSSWQRMTLNDWNIYRNDIINFYAVNEGVPIIETFTRNYCCMKTSDDIFVYGEGLGRISLCHTSNFDIHFEGDVYKFSGDSPYIEYDNLNSVTSFISTISCAQTYHTELFVRCNNDNDSKSPTANPTINPTININEGSTCGIGLDWSDTNRGFSLYDMATGYLQIFSSSPNFNALTGSGLNTYYSTDGGVGTTSNLYTFDPITLMISSSPIEEISGWNVRCLALNSNNKLIYAVYDGPVVTDRLYTINQTSGKVSFVGNVGTETTIQGCEFDENNILYSWSGSLGLITIDINNGNVTQIGSTSNTFLSQYVTFDPDDNDVIFVDDQSSVYQVNKNSGTFFERNDLTSIGLRGYVLITHQQCGCIKNGNCSNTSPTNNPTNNPTNSPSEDIFEFYSTTQDEEINNRCCRATRTGRLINYSCRQFNRRQCNNDALCRYRRDVPGC